MPPSFPIIKTDPDAEDALMEQAEDENDEVVREIPVLLSPALASQLYLMQFPLQPQQVPLPETARIKQQHGMIELDESVPANAGTEGMFSLNQRTLASQNIPVSTHMALGKMSKNGELHIVPLSHIVQMRPSFTHIDEANNNNAEMVDTKEEEKLEKKPVLLQKKETERAAQARKSSYAFKKASEESEAWKILHVCGPDTIQYQTATDRIACPSPYTPLVAPSATQSPGSTFVHSLNYLPKPESVLNVDDDKTPESHLGTICAQLTVALQRGWPVPFSVLQSQFATVDNHDLLTALSSCAVLVRGNFLLQSRLLPLTPVLQQVRTFILYLLQRAGSIERGRLERVFSETPGVTSEAIEMLLNQVATRGANGAWQLKIHDDLSIYQVYPEQTQLHSQYWERQETRFADLVEQYNAVAV